MMVLRSANIMSVNAPVWFITGSCLILHKQVGEREASATTCARGLNVLWNGTVFRVGRPGLSHDQAPR